VARFRERERKLGRTDLILPVYYVAAQELDDPDRRHAGRLDLEGCDISSQAGSCVYISDGADPRVRRNTIHDGKSNGVYVYAGGLGTLEDNEITGNGQGAWLIDKDCEPNVTRARNKE
jgi:parallel beta-helix repeat protein